jgi:hypothetical protein
MDRIRLTFDECVDGKLRRPVGADQAIQRGLEGELAEKFPMATVAALNASPVAGLGLPQRRCFGGAGRSNRAASFRSRLTITTPAAQSSVISNPLERLQSSR